MNPMLDTLNSDIILYNILTRLYFYCTELKNVRVRYVRKIIFAVEKQCVLHILSVCLSPNYPAHKAHAPYYIVICSVSGSTTFFKTIS
jgi:hypothetical protein